MASYLLLPQGPMATGNNGNFEIHRSTYDSSRATEVHGITRARLRGSSRRFAAA
jgi:hypothetical protein